MDAVGNYRYALIRLNSGLEASSGLVTASLSFASQGLRYCLPSPAFRHHVADA